MSVCGYLFIHFDLGMPRARSDHARRSNRSLFESLEASLINRVTHPRIIPWNEEHPLSG